MSTTPKARIATLAAAAPQKEQPEDEATTSDNTGWDPYEVWRTRVLLPRLQESAAADQPKKPEPTKPYLLHSH